MNKNSYIFVPKGPWTLGSQKLQNIKRMIKENNTRNSFLKLFLGAQGSKILLYMAEGSDIWPVDVVGFGDLISRWPRVRRSGMWMSKGSDM